MCGAGFGVVFAKLQHNILTTNGADISVQGQANNRLERSFVPFPGREP
jgi:hypothetical protein